MTVLRSVIWGNWVPGRTIPGKLAVLVTLIIGAIATFFYWLVPARLGEQAFGALESKAQSLAEMAAFSVRSAVVFDDQEAIEEALEGVANSPDVLYVAVTDTDHNLIAYLQADGALDIAARPTPDSKWARAVYRLSIPVEWAGDTIAQVSMGVRASEVQQQVRQAREGAAQISALVFLTGMLAVVLGSRFITGPLNEMVRTAQRISEGDLSERADIRSRDEVGRLARAFNLMVGRLHAAQEALEESNRDLEERVEQRTRQLMESEQLLRQAQKMEAVGRLAAGVAHDFNNLLTVINGHAELSLMLLDDDSPIRDSLESISSAGASAAALTNQLLAFSRKQVLQPVDLDLNNVVQEMAQILEGLVGETVQLKLRLDPSIGLVRADASQLQQVIMNLAVNAKDAMPNGGDLTIATRIRSLRSASDLLDEEMQPGEYIALEIVDTGQGMSEDVRTRAFEPFFSTKPSGKGTGLGLSTVYGIIAQSGGRVALESREARGTKCTILLPQIPSGEGFRHPRQGESVSLGGSERILLVEDATQVRCLARRMLEREGYAVVEAEHGIDALGRLGEYDGDFDLVLTDVVMPRMNGRELAEAVGREYPEIAVVYMSGYTDDEVVLGGVRDHDVAFIEKPFDRMTLLSTIRGALDQREPAGA